MARLCLPSLQRWNMSPRTTLPLILCLTLLFHCRSLPPAGRDFERSYVSVLRLSPAEEREAIGLASTAGVTAIKSIETFFVQPGGIPAIQVTEVGTVTGRVVKYRSIAMGWERAGTADYVEGTKPGGKIIAQSPKVSEETILASGEKEYRVTLKEGLSAEEAEEILGCFLNGRIRYAKRETPEETYGRVVDFTDPSSLGFNPARKLHSITFRSEVSHRWSTYYGSLEGNVFVIQKVVTFQA